MSEKLKKNWTIIAALVGWGGVIVALAYGRIEGDTLEAEYIQQNKAKLVDHEARIRHIEEDREQLATMASDIEWIKRHLQNGR